MDLLACLWAPSSHLKFPVVSSAAWLDSLPSVPNAQSLLQTVTVPWRHVAPQSCTLEAVYPTKAGNISCHRHPCSSSALFSSRQPGCFCSPLTTASKCKLCCLYLLALVFIIYSSLLAEHFNLIRSHTHFLSLFVFQDF